MKQSKKCKAMEHPLYRRWARMRQGVYNPHSPEYHNIGARGIGLGPELENFWDFVDQIETHLGAKPKGDWKLARLDHNGDFTIKNLEWAQSKAIGRRLRNTYTITYRRRKYLIREWSEITGINYMTLVNRLMANWTPAQILGYELSPREKSKGRRLRYIRQPKNKKMSFKV